MGVDAQLMARNIIREKYTIQESQKVAPLQDPNANYKYGGEGAFGSFFPERREVISPEQSGIIGYNLADPIIETTPAQYGEPQFDRSYSPLNRSLSSLRGVLTGGIGEAIGKTSSALRGLIGGVSDYAVDQYRAGMAGGTLYEDGELTRFDPTSMAIGMAPTGINAFRAAKDGSAVVGAMGGNIPKARSALHDIGENVPVEQRLKAAREKWESNSSDKGLRENYLNIRRERDSLGGSVDKVAPEAQPTIEDYRGSHQPPDREYGASLDDLSSMIPEDIYSPSGPRLYGLGDPSVDREAFASLNKARGNPRQEVPVYRAVPLNVDDINAGDWVTTSRRYAEMHGDNALGGEYKILEQNARAGDLQSEGYPYEFGFNPLDPSSKARMQRAEEGGFNRDIYHKTWGENFEGEGAFSSFDPERMQQSDYGYAGKGVYATPQPLGGSTYGNVTMPLKTNISNPYIRTLDNWQDDLDPYQWIPKNADKFESNDAASTAWTEMMQSKGYDGFIDESSKNGEIVIFDPKNIRSTNAEFDPTKADSSNLLSGISRSSLRDIA
tara:strand:- start:458 stop:2116 length:1659 start_codon:yes stop_codon:yes gene_type:complete